MDSKKPQHWQSGYNWLKETVLSMSRIGLQLNHKIAIMFLVVIATAIIGITYGSMVLNNQAPQSSTSTINCNREDLAGNFTSSPQMNETSTGPYSLTFYIYNLGPQSATITEYNDGSGLTQTVNWTVPASTTQSFQTTLYKTESSLILETSCKTLFTTNVYYPIPSGSAHANHYNVTLYVSLGGSAK